MTSPYWPAWLVVPLKLIVPIACFYFLYWSMDKGETLKKDPNSSPLWGSSLQFLGFLAVIVVAPAHHATWYEKRVLAEFIENLAAYFFHYGTFAFGIYCGYQCGIYVAMKSRLQWLGWCMGILVFLLIFGISSSLALQIPGVGWRMKEISKATDDYDRDYR